MFDAFIAPSLNKSDIYVITLRNPKDYKFSSSLPIDGFVLSPQNTAKQVLEDLIKFRESLSDMLSQTYDEIMSSQGKLILGAVLFFASPSDLMEYDTNVGFYNALLMTLNILDKIGIRKGITADIINHELVYYPVFILKDFEQAYEPALKKEESKSFSALLKIREVRQLLISIISQY